MDDNRDDIIDHGGRRLGIDRRQVELPYSGEDRRHDDMERRCGVDRRAASAFPEASDDRREAFHLKLPRK